MHIAIIGAGAAGCFCAINLKRICPNANISIYEGGRKALAKVAVTGGGRCNLTNTFQQVTDLKQVYPRGDKLMKRALQRFSQDDTWQWFEGEGVKLIAQDDECIFPKSQNAMQIVNTLLGNIHKQGIGLHTSHKVSKIEHSPDGRYQLQFTNESIPATSADYCVICTGGHPSLKGFEMLSPLGFALSSPLPSLFTLNIAGDWHQSLMGTVVEDVTITLAGTKFKSRGAILLTHWGMSGPAILKLTSYAARHLAEQNYTGQILINWLGASTEEEAREVVKGLAKDYPARQTTNVYPRQLTAKHWSHLLAKSHIAETQRWGSLNAKETNRLVNTLCADPYSITGKCPFKEEFVTCGGVSLSNININTLESKQHQNLFLAGEILDVDGVTGGFNLQAAWSMGYIISQEIATREERRKCKEEEENM